MTSTHLIDMKCFDVDARGVDSGGLKCVTQVVIMVVGKILDVMLAVMELCVTMEQRVGGVMGQSAPVPLY